MAACYVVIGVFPQAADPKVSMLSGCIRFTYLARKATSQHNVFAVLVYHCR